LDEEENFATIFNKQLDLYGQDGELTFEPFSILKIVHEDDSEVLLFDKPNSIIYGLITDQPYAVVDLENESIIVNGLDVKFAVKMGKAKTFMERIQLFYDNITMDNEMEGIVIKPDDAVYIPGVAPYLKVRNERYLTIVYGHNFKFPSKYQKLINKKRIGRKLSASIKEFEVGMKLLKTPFSELNLENKPYMQLLANMMFEIDKEKELDPRL